MNFIKKYWLLISILVVAAFFRFYSLGTIPPGLHPDEAANGLDIIRMIEQHDFQSIYDTNGPREALFFYLQAIPVFIGKTFHIAAINFTPLALRITPAIIGILTVFGIYLLGKEFYNKNVGLFAAGTMAVSAWHTQFSRNGFRAIMIPFVLVFMFYFFIRAYRESKLIDYILTAIFFAMGFYTYLPFRMVPLVLIAMGIYILVTNRNFVKNNIKNLVIFAGVFLVALVPLFVHFYHVPADMAGRSSTSIFNPELNGGSPVKTFASNVVKTAEMFNFQGDENFRHNLGGTPMLDPIVGILFWVGLIIIVAGLLKFENFILVMWGGALAMPELLTAEGIPHALRLVGIMPVVFLAFGIALDFIITKLKLVKYQTAIMSVLLIVSAGFGFHKYFVAFPTYGATGEAYAEDMVSIAHDINNASASRKNILIVGEYGTKTVDFITHSSGHTYTRYETRDVAKDLTLPSDNFKIFIQKDWYDEAKNGLLAKDVILELTPVLSKIDNRIIYYEYEKN